MAPAPPPVQPQLLQQFGWCAHPLRKKHIGEGFALIDPHSARNQQRGHIWRNRFDFFDELSAINPGHHQIGQDQINAALAEHQ